MKQTGKNEIDLLLRSLARRERTNSVLRDGAAEDQSPGMHLDADELNSYAEQALPAATRARYTTHLADCSRCRQLVSELTSAAGGRVHEPLIEQKTSGAFWQKVGALLSPAVLRYAVPTLALFAVIAVGLVALRQHPQSDFVAQNQPSVSGGTIELKKTDTSAVNNSAAISQDSRSNESQRSAGTLRDKQAKASETGDVAKPISPTTDSLSVGSEKDASKGKAGGVVAEPPFAPEPPPRPAPKSEVSTAAERKDADVRQKEEAAKREPSIGGQEVARARTEDNQKQVAASKPQNASPASRNAAGLRTMDARSGTGGGAKKSDDEVETRTVSGRRFRREGNVWVDTGYQSSTATTNVRRDSEQYRALIADEPGIRDIAEQLQGEVVLVWKGKAYRIR